MPLRLWPLGGYLVIGCGIACDVGWVRSISFFRYISFCCSSLSSLATSNCKNENGKIPDRQRLFRLITRAQLSFELPEWRRVSKRSFFSITEIRQIKNKIFCIKLVVIKLLI